jgi:predicted RNase H-like HicB family nuclease
MLYRDEAMRTYRVVIEHDRENETYWARVPALPGCFTQGDTVADVLDHLQEAIALYLDGLKADGEPIPDGDAPMEEEPIRLTVTVAA